MTPLSYARTTALEILQNYKASAKAVYFFSRETIMPTDTVPTTPSSMPHFIKEVNNCQVVVYVVL
jgi:hypothetical protein